jgi:hypothetical protein
MKRPCEIIGTLWFILAVSANTLCAQPYTFDENGNGTSTVLLFNPPVVDPLPYSVASDPTGGITTSPVLIYSLGYGVVSGDVAFMGPDGTTIADLLRFFTPTGSHGSEVIFYSQVGGGSLADVGIPSTTNPVEISESSPVTQWLPSGSQPGAGIVFPVFARFQYAVTVIDTPEPSTTALLFIFAMVWLTGRGSSRAGGFIRKGLQS